MSKQTEREELARLLGVHFPQSAAGDDYLWSMADIIMGRGYRKLYTITSYEDLDALPIGSLVLTEQGGYWESVRRTDGRNRWLEPSQPEDAWLAVSEDLTLPATAIYTPEVTA